MFWDEELLVWRILTESGEEIVADVVVSAIGMFCDLSYPDIQGLDSFKGTTFHSARWNYDHDLAGERVGVIGSAASAVQFVPEIAKEAGQLHLFQRTANWVLAGPRMGWRSSRGSTTRCDCLPRPLAARPARPRN